MGSRGGDRRRKWRRWVVEEEIGGRGGEKIRRRRVFRRRG